MTDIDPNDIDRLLALAALVKDATKVEEAVAAIKAEQTELQTMIGQHADALDRIRDDRSAADAALADVKRIETENAYWKTQNEAKEKAVYDREVAITAREQAATQFEVEVKRREASVNESHNNLDHRMAEIEGREQAAADKLSRAEELLASYDEAKHAAAVKLAE